MVERSARTAITVLLCGRPRFIAHEARGQCHSLFVTICRLTHSIHVSRRRSALEAAITPPWEGVRSEHQTIGRVCSKALFRRAAAHATTIHLFNQGGKRRARVEKHRQAADARHRASDEESRNTRPALGTWELWLLLSSSKQTANKQTTSTRTRSRAAEGTPAAQPRGVYTGALGLGDMMNGTTIVKRLERLKLVTRGVENRRASSKHLLPWTRDNQTLKSEQRRWEEERGRQGL